MLRNAFIGQRRPPTGGELSRALGSASPRWRQVLGDLKAAGIEDEEWNSYSPRAGWSLRLQHAGRNIVYLSPAQGSFMASFALGDRAMKVARASGFSPKVMTILKQARRYAEGTAVRVAVETSDDVDVVTKLAAIKLAN